MPTTSGTKPFKTYDEQIALLKSRGLVIADDEKAKELLKKTNYYRLSAYSLTLRQNDTFYPNVSIDDIVSLYEFDALLRQIVFDFSSRAETAARAYIAYYHAEKHGPLGYLDNRNFDDEWKHAGFLKELKLSIERSSEVFVAHHKDDLGGVYPVWVVIEETTFGSLSKFFKNMVISDRNEISKKYYGLSREYVESFLQCASVARNIAAHGGRFYNRVNLSPAVKLTPKLKALDNRRPGAYLYAIYSILPTDDKAPMLLALRKAFEKYSFVSPKYLGLPDDWLQLFEVMR